MKKVLAAVLAFAMVVTGLYLVKPEASEVKAATTVPADMLDIKLQAIGGENNTMRLITSVDSLDYKEVGFIVNNGTAETKMRTWTVYEKIKSSVEGSTYNFSPKLIGSSSEYFATVKFDVLYPDSTYTVQAYVITNDSQTIKGREIRSFQYADGTADNYVNLLVEGELTGELTATYGPNADATDYTADSVTILGVNEGYTSVKVDLAGDATVDGLTSATKFIFSDGSTAVYRNYYTTHKNGTTTATADTSWYDVEPTATSYVIASSADMYGFATVVNAGTTSFEGRTVTLVADVALNDGKVTLSTATAAPSWTPDDTANDKITWPYIGNATGKTDGSKSFRGTFDGDGNEISGIYRYGGGAGLFGHVSGSGVVLKNFKVVNSYMYGGGSYYHSAVVKIAAQSAHVTMENICIGSDTVIYCSARSVGGFVATLYWDTAVTINNSWFDGEIYYSGTGAGYSISPFVGYHQSSRGNVTLTNCLNTANVVSKSTTGPTSYGAFYGYGANEFRTITLTNCVDMGTVSLAMTTSSGSLIGRPGKELETATNEIIATNVFVSSESGAPSVYVGEENGFVITLTNVNTVAPSALQNLSATQLLEKLPETTAGEGCAWGYAADGTLMPNEFINWYNAQ